ncbi:MAG TPA: serine hydrolase, partial [Halothiobacillus sp.]|nr:serine hydrolase [Halothiobacillus sp.]
MSKHNHSAAPVLRIFLAATLAVTSLSVWAAPAVLATPVQNSVPTPNPVPTLNPKAVMPVPGAPVLSARSYVLMDANTGQIIVDKNADQPVPPASITKLMTSYLVFSALKSGDIHMNDMVTISKNAWQMQGSKMFIEVGKQVSVENLLRGMIVQSGNDAATALAEYVGGNQESFVAQ